MNRTERRAAMRLHQQHTTAAAQINPTLVVPTAAPAAAPEPTLSSATISEIQLAANRANALHSTGPRTATGRAISSQNALKTGITSARIVLLSPEEAVEYKSLIDAHLQQFNPAGVIEFELVQAIADNAWRIRRLSTLEHALFAVGRIEFAEKFKGKEVALLDLHTTQVFEKSFRNYHIQENRLSNRRDKDLAQLHALQAERRAKEDAALAEVASIYAAAEQAGEPFTPTPDKNGFVFSTDQIKQFLAAQTAPPAAQTPRKASPAPRRNNLAALAQRPLAEPGV